MAKIGYAGALGGIAKDAIGGAGKAFVGGLKGAFLRETPGLTAGYAFAKELGKRANSPKMASGGTPPPVNQQTSTSPAMGGLAASVSLVAGQNKSNVINLEQVRQLQQLNNSVITQSKLIAFQIADQKRKDQFAEETANEQAIRDDALLNAIKNIGGGFGGGGKKATGNEKAAGGLGLVGEIAASAAGGVAGGFLKDGLKYVTTAIVSAIGIGLAFFRNQIAALVLSAALRFGGGAALGGAVAAVGAGLAISASAIAAIVAGVAALLFPTNAGAATGPNADTRDGRDAANDPAGAKRRRAAEDATAKRAGTRSQIPGREKEWDERFGKTHDPATGLLKDPKATTIYTPPAKGNVSSNFGEKRKDSTGKDTVHQGVDIAMSVGTDVSPIASGKVTKVQTSGAAGTYVQVTHPDGKISEYMHLSQALAKVGDDVTLASIIGKSGGAKGDMGAGSSTGPHLHLQLKTGSGESIDPTSLPGLAGLTKGEKVSPADNTPKSTPSADAGAGGKQKRKDETPKVKIDNTVARFFNNLPDDPNGGPGSTSNVGIKLAEGLGFKLDGGGGGDAGYPFALSSAGDRPSGMGSGTGLRIKNKPIPTEDLTVKKAIDNVAKGLGVDPKSGTQLPTKQTSTSTALQTKVLKPLFRNNSDIIAETNKTFLQQFRQTATSAFTQGLTKALFPKGFGVSAATAGADNNYRGQQLQKIFGTDKVINDATTKLLGKQYGPMFAPLFNNLAQGYLEVGSRVAGNAIFQGLGGLGAQETQTITGQVLGNFASGNKKLALEQLLYGASGGKNGGIALGPETLFAKYGFKNPAEGIQYFSSVLGEQVTQPFASLMGANDRNKSVIWNPRAGANGTGAFVYADSGREASEPDIRASGNYGAPVSQTSMIPSRYNNYEYPYGPTGPRNIVGGASAYKQVVDPNTGKMVAPNRQQILGLTDQQYMADKAGNDQKADIQIELMKQQADKQAKYEAEAIKAAAERQAQQLEANKQYDDAASVRSQAETKANEYVTKNGADSIVVAVEKAGGTGGNGSKPQGLKEGDTVRKSGQLFGGKVDDKGNVGPLSGMQEIGNFAFDMAKNAAGAALTKDIKNPYMQMVANFAIQKGLNYGVDALFGKNGLDLGKMFDSGIGSIKDFFMGTPIVPDMPFVGDAIDLGGLDFLFAADGGIATKATPTIFGEKGAEAIIPLSNPTATKALSAAMGTAETNNQLATSNDSLASIDNSLLRISGGGSGSGTSFSSYGGTAFDVGLGSPSGGSLSGGGANTVLGVSRSRPTQQKPSTMDYVTAIGGSMLKSFAISKAVGMASTALFGATPGVLAGNALISAGFPTLGGMLGGTLMTGTGLTAGAGGIGLTAGSGAASLASMGGGTGLVASSSALGGTLGTSAAASGTGSLLATEGAVGATTAASAGTLGTFGSSLVAAAPYLLAAVAAFMILDSYGGGGSSAPPPKEPKFHAAIWVLGNNNVNAIAPIYETQEYHAVPDAYKTIAYGLLKVAFNATKVSEQATKVSAPYDYLYMKVQFDRVSLLWGKGAPNASTLTADTAPEVKQWPAVTPDTNMNAYAKDIIDLIRDEFKKTATAENLSKLDASASQLSNYTLNDLSSGLAPDLKSGAYKLDTSTEKGIYADSVAESKRIGDLISAAAKNKAYMTDATYTGEGKAGYDDFGNQINYETKPGVAMVYSLKDGKFVENKYPGALILDAAGRPVYDIEGTSTGLSVEDFVSSSVAGADRSANILVPPPVKTDAGGTGTTNNTAVGGAKIDNSSVTNFYNSLSTVTDFVRSTTNQVGLIG